MSEDRATLRALTRLLRPDARLSPTQDGAAYGVFPGGDRRKRCLSRLTADVVADLARAGSLENDGAGYVLTAAGRARLTRAEAPEDEAWRAQHDTLVARAVADRDGDIAYVRGLSTGGAAARLAKLKDASGAAFFAPPEIAAAARLETDLQAGQEGLVRGSDWLAPPRGAAPRAGGAEVRKTNAMDARARFAEAIRALTPAAAHVVREALVRQTGMEAIERRAGWPARSAKVALKFALQELAAFYRTGRGTSAKG